MFDSPRIISAVRPMELKYAQRSLRLFGLKHDRLEEAIHKGISYAYSEAKMDAPAIVVTYEFDKGSRHRSEPRPAAAALRIDGRNALVVLLNNIFDEELFAGPLKSRFALIMDALFVHEGDHFVMMDSILADASNPVKRAILEGHATLLEHKFISSEAGPEVATKILATLNPVHYAYAEFVRIVLDIYGPEAMAILDKRPPCSVFELYNPRMYFKKLDSIKDIRNSNSILEQD